MTLSLREKQVLAAGIFLAVVFLWAGLVVMPALDKRSALEKQLESKQESLVRMRSLAREYGEITSAGEKAGLTLAGRPGNFTLFSFLDTLARESGVKDNIAYMKPSFVKLEKSSHSIALVKLKLDNLGYAGLVDYLARIEGSENGVFIKSLALAKTGRDMNFLEAVIEAQTLVPGEPAP
jgi:general secretion pathway protein M